MSFSAIYASVRSAHDTWCVFWILCAAACLPAEGIVSTVAAAFAVLFALHSLKRYLFDDLVVQMTGHVCGGGGGSKVARTAAPVLPVAKKEARLH